jgi:hypothetical protein
VHDAILTAQVLAFLKSDTPRVKLFFVIPHCARESISLRKHVQIGSRLFIQVNAEKPVIPPTSYSAFCFNGTRTVEQLAETLSLMLSNHHVKILFFAKAPPGSQCRVLVLILPSS